MVPAVLLVALFPFDPGYVRLTRTIVELLYVLERGAFMLDHGFVVIEQSQLRYLRNLGGLVNLLHKVLLDVFLNFLLLDLLDWAGLVELSRHAHRSTCSSGGKSR